MDCGKLATVCILFSLILFHWYLNICFKVVTMQLSESAKYLLMAEKAELQDKIVLLQKRVIEINTLLEFIENRGVNLTERILASLKQAKDPLTTNELLHSVFYDKERVVKDKNARRRCILQLSLSLHRLCNKGSLYSENVTKNEKIYCLPEWRENPAYEYILMTKKSKIKEEKNRFFSVKA